MQLCVTVCLFVCLFVCVCLETVFSVFAHLLTHCISTITNKLYVS